MKAHISIPEWLSLDRDTRRQYMSKFQIRASGPTSVVHDVNGRTTVISDGVMDKDLDVSFSIEHMIEYLKEDLPWYREDLIERLFKLTQDKFYGRSVEWYDRNDEERLGGNTGSSGSDGEGGSPEGAKPGRKGKARKGSPVLPSNA